MHSLFSKIRSWKRKNVLFWAGVACAFFALTTAFSGSFQSTSEPLQGIALAVVSLALFKACALSDEL
ncbi:MAG TPA: hypothetical protein VF681_15800 [Abditibacteriaceae bacterium]